MHSYVGHTIKYIRQQSDHRGMGLGISVCGETCQFPAGWPENTLQVADRARASRRPPAKYSGIAGSMQVVARMVNSSSSIPGACMAHIVGPIRATLLQNMFAESVHQIRARTQEHFPGARACRVLYLGTPRIA